MSHDERVKFTQVSLFSVLLSGRYDGVISLADVKRIGDMSIATMDRLDGEMQMIDGVRRVLKRSFRGCAPLPRRTPRRPNDP